MNGTVEDLTNKKLKKILQFAQEVGRKVKEEPKITIIVATHDVEKYLARCLDSVVSQTFEKLEILCIDNASQDKTYEILQAYASKDQRVRIIRNDENKGIAYSRNKGIEEARGEYVYFVDADDCITENAIGELKRVIEEENPDLILFDAIAEFENEELRKKFEHIRVFRKKEYPTCSGEDMFIQLRRDGMYTAALWRQCFKRSLYIENDIKFDNIRYYEDNFFSLRIMLSSKKAVCLHEALYVYYRRADSQTTNKDGVTQFKCGVYSYCKMMKFWLRARYKEETSKTLGGYLQDYYFWTIASMKQEKGIWYLDFEDPYERHVYNIFKANHEFFSEFRDELDRCDNIVVYGAGVMGKKLLGEYKNKKIIGVAVTKKDEKTPERICGYEVKELCEYKNLKNVLIIVAVMENLQKELITNLKKEGFQNYICVI